MEPSKSDFEGLTQGLYQIQDWDHEVITEWSRHRYDGSVTLVWRGKRARYFYEYKQDWSEKTFQSALQQLRSYGNQTAQPLLILPFLRPSQLTTLAQEGLSGLDLSGNACLHFGDDLLLITGQPSRYSVKQTVKNPFTGRSSLVARMLLVKPVFKTGLELKGAIEDRGGTISQSLVSRILQELTKEVLVVPDDHGNRIRVTDPARLLGLLAAQWRDEAKLLWRGRAGDQSQSQVLTVLFHTGQRPMAVTGLGSVGQQTSLTTDAHTALYVEKVGTLPDAVGGMKTSRFPNLSFYRPTGPEVFFDSRETTDGVRYASPVQTYLECVSGDARLQQAAEELRQQILDDLSHQFEEPD